MDAAGQTSTPGDLRAADPTVALYTINLGSMHLARHEPEVAEALVREGLRIRLLSPALVPNRRRLRREDDWSIGGTKSLFGASLEARGRYDEAEIWRACLNGQLMRSGRRAPAWSTCTTPGASA